MSDQLAKDLFKAVESLSVEGLAILNGEGEFLYMNPRHAEMYGYTYDELLGKSWKKLYSENTANYIEKEIMPQLFEQGRWQQTLAGKKKDGSEVICRVTLTTLDVGLFCVCEDVTNLINEKEAEKKNMIQRVLSIAGGL
jgi:PAS domain S-box-containing protein